MAFDAGFQGGVTVGSAFSPDVNGIADIIAEAGPGGGPTVRVFDGSIPQLNAPVEGVSIPGFLGTFHAFDENFSGGVFVASGDVDGNGRDDITVSQGASTDPNADPRVTMFSGLNSQILTNFLAYDAGFQGGVTVGSVFGPDVNGIADIIAGAGPGAIAEPNLNVFSIQNGIATNINSQTLFGPGFASGISVAGASPTPELA